MTDSKTIKLSFDDILLSKYENTPYKQLIETSLIGCKKIFWILYDSYNTRFKAIYKTELELLYYYYLYFLHLDNFFENEIIPTIQKEIRKNLTKGKNDTLQNIKVYFVDNEKDFAKKIKTDQKSSKQKCQYIGIIKNEIKRDIEHHVFYETDYFISIAEKKKNVLDPFNKHYEEYSNMYLHYTRTGKIMDSIRLEKKEYKHSRAIAYDPYYQRYRQFITANKKLKSDIKTIENKIIEHLKELN